MQTNSYSLYGAHETADLQNILNVFLFRSNTCRNCTHIGLIVYSIYFHVNIMLTCPRCHMSSWVNRDDPFCCVVYQYWPLEKDIKSKYSPNLDTLDDYIKVKTTNYTLYTPNSMRIRSYHIVDENKTYHSFARYLHMTDHEKQNHANNMLCYHIVNNNIDDPVIQQFIISDFYYLNLQRYVGLITAEVLLNNGFLEPCKRFKKLLFGICNTNNSSVSFLSGMNKVLLAKPHFERELAETLLFLQINNIVTPINILQWFLKSHDNTPINIEFYQQRSKFLTQLQTPQ